MLSLFFTVTIKLFLVLLNAVVIAIAAIGILWAWNAISPKTFEEALRKVARYFK